MATGNTLVYFAAGRRNPPGLIHRFGEAHGLELLLTDTTEDVLALLNRSFPACLVLDASQESATVLQLCSTIKADPFTSIVPTVILVSNDGRGVGELPAAGLQAGADEVVSDLVSEEERSLRLELVLRRAARDVNVHPTTRLPGTAQIERDFSERMRARSPFAVCYADLDHFKEFNDRYGYNSGDSVIYLTSRILRDVVRSLAPSGFVGHIGGDDFIFNVPLDRLETCCDEVIHLFDELIPYQYTEEDRKAGYFLGKDRRGTVHRIPLMTLSIGVVTNLIQKFSHTAQVSELAAEMKAYAKTLPGSVYVVDRRGLTGTRDKDAPQNRAMDLRRSPPGSGWSPRARP
ncbi:MAG: diguanylate cyclase [Gemmatimonadota bacterium]|jgi:diguanylate cyclase (GGDEF)-like protein